LKARAREVKRAEQRSQLARLSRIAVLCELSGAVAHEINQPLTAIANYAYACVRLLRSGATTQAEALEAMTRVAAEAERAGEVVRKMRSFVRGDEGQASALDVNYLVREVLRLAAPEARQSGVVLEVDLVEDLPAVFADSIQIQQVLLNLVRNAVEAISSADSIQREVRIATRRTDPGAVEITVTDTGPGVPETDLEKVFEPFHTTKADGVGIGLALSRSIADAHSGKLWASLPAGGGAAFHLRLPAEEASRTDG
jgi:two-component system, LuxR family, sensor kinase FixL